jgi:hypothetical protein
MLENDHKIEDVKRQLYDREDSVTHRSKEGVIHVVNHKVENEWTNDEINKDKMKKPKTSIFKKFFIFSIFFFICAIGFTVYMFYNVDSSVSSDNIDITVVGNAFTKGGEELPLQIEIVNRNKASLELSNLQISYPNGASDDASDVVRLPRISIGTIKPGETVIKNIKVVLYGEEKSNRNVNISLDYHPEGSNAIFTKEKDYSVNINQAPLSLIIDAPDNITSDQPISIKIKSILNTSLPSGDSVLQVTYPNNFVYENAVPAPVFGNSMWSLSDLSLENPLSVTVNGRIIGEDKDQQVFHVYAGTTKSNDKSTIDVVYNSLLHTITLVKPFLEANIIAVDTSSSGNVVNVKIAWKNNLSTRITDGEIIANISGNVLDKSSISPTDGYFDSANNRIVWDRNSNSELGDIEPGDKGEVSFSVKSLSLVGSDSTVKEPELIFDVSIRGRQPSLGSTYTEVNNFSKKVVKILSDFQIASSASYKSGLLPPKAESETKYDIAWTLSNSTNGINNAVARASLPGYVKWVGSNSPRENITYNEITREVVWNIGTVRANTGGSYNREASFTVSLTPSISQVGSVPQLMKELSLSGTDVFTGTDINIKRSSINTLLSGDPNFQNGFERVIQ